jgi:alpha-glucosidase
MPDRRTFVLSRAGFAGIQRYAANWMGDNMSRWDHLAMSIPMAMGLGVSGQPFVGADIGGFGNATNPELLVRWTQYGILTPFCRNHNMNPQDQYPWTFGTAVETLIREAIALRYRLLPYLYTAFVQASEDGRPVQRPLLFDYQDDVACRGRDDQYLLGDHLLVAPVLAAGQTARHVYLPAGGWYHWTSEECFAGEQLVTVAAPLDEIPLFVRAGAVVPLWPTAPASTMDYAPETLQLHCFLPEQDGTLVSELVEDDGLSFDFRQGAERRTRFTVTRQGQQVTVRAESHGAGYAESRRQSFELVLHGAPAASAQLAGRPLPASSAGSYLIANRGEAFSVALTLAPVEE